MNRLFKASPNFLLYRVALPIFLVIGIGPMYGQCPTAGYNIAGGACAGQAVNFNNGSVGATSYQWNFCGGALTNGTRFGTTLNNTTINSPYAATPVFDGSGKYIFTINDGNATITRMEFGNSYDNVPTETNLGNPDNNLSSPQRSNLSFVNDNGNWYAATPTFSNGTVVVYSFGNNLMNAPTSIAHSFPSLAGNARYCNFFIDNGNYYLLVGMANSSIEIVSFGNSMSNVPTSVNVSVNGGSAGLVADVTAVRDCDKIYVFAASLSASAVIKLEFQNDFTAAPVQTVLTPSGNGFVNPIAVLVAHDGLKWKGLVQNLGGGIIDIDFGSAIDNDSPVNAAFTFSGAVAGGYDLAMTIDETNNYYLVATNFDNSKVSTIKVSNGCTASIYNSTQLNPSVNYQSSGTVYVAVTAYDSQGNSNIYTDSLVLAAVPNNSFTANNLCFGDLSQFVNSTTISSGSINSFKWYFGDNDSSSAINPSHTYGSTGAYNVTLIAVSDAGCTDTLTAVIGISSKPSAAFIFSAACAGSAINFTDNSTIGAGTIAQWFWQFGNGDTAIDQNPVYLYPLGGSYSVQLTVTSDSGCTASNNSPITIAPTPEVSFNVTNTCVGQTVQFVNATTSVSPIIGYDWDFGDSNTASTQNPTHSYGAIQANYQVMCVATAANGCIDTLLKEIRISNIPSPAFTTQSVNLCEGNVVNFIDQSSVLNDTISGWLWNFGDGQTDTVQNPSHIYANAGSYNVSLIAFSPTSCGNGIITPITVRESPDAGITSINVCLGAITQFTDASIPAAGSILTDYLWMLEDTNVSTFPNPQYLYGATGSYHVTLMVTDNFGCTNTDSTTVSVYPNPQASFTASNTCSNLFSNFLSTAIVDSGSSIASYAWNFGDPASGSSNFSSTINPSHVYTDTSTRVVSLIVTTNFGCLDTVINIISVKPSAVPNFQYTPTCFGSLMSFTNLTTGAPDTAWVWNFGDTQFNQLENPAHYYAFPGTYNVTLTVTANTGCVGSISKQVEVSPIPDARFATQPYCVGNSYSLYDSSVINNGAITQWKWSINGIDTSGLQNPSFFFGDTGSYVVQLLVTSDIGCKDSISKIIQVFELPNVNFTFTPQFGNPPLLVAFSNATINGNTYQWHFGDGGSSGSINPQHLYQDTGRFDIQLIATSIHNCIDSLTKKIYVIKPILDIAILNTTYRIENNLLYINAEVANLGTRDINSYKMEARVDGGSSLQESVISLLPNGPAGVAMYNFTAALQIPQGVTVGYYCVNALLPNDQADDVELNNVACESFDQKFVVVSPYPNPFNDQILIQSILPFEDDLQLELYNTLGQVVVSASFNGNAGLNSFAIDGTVLNSGIYFLRCSFRDNEAVITKQIVKMNPSK